MLFNRRTVVGGFALALLLLSCRADTEASSSTAPCPMIGTMDCIKDSACRSCCIRSGYTDGHCN
ncbi:hypothetical protein PVAP13_8NG100800 [Panicum virgatum]|uniref:Uncharacterized protein n=1 Tax=Panicum virgatum TaxID=38727 RepID=A0A8T0PB72_PANVG|nr:hypothetical protein PVAP13_8NG100800 [Panicum virgatum]